jgi:hypothetical protein
MSDYHAAFDIPEEFWSAYSDEPFTSCIQCEKPLTDELTPYAIQKHFVAAEAVFEMAICVECAARLQQSFSSHSRNAIQDFVRNAPERQRRRQEADRMQPPDLEAADHEQLADEIDRLEKWQRVQCEQAMASCAICGKARNECQRYSLGTACLGSSLINASPDADHLGSPFLICEGCETALNEGISAQTRDAWDRFVGENFDGPPELAVDPHELVAIF